MKKFLNIFFVTLGIIFFVLIFVSLYLYAIDFLNIRSLVSGSGSGETVTSDGVDKHPLLNETQEAALEDFGVDPSNVPDQISSEQEACFREKLGDERVEEIKAGDTPNTIELLKAKDCI